MEGDQVASTLNEFVRDSKSDAEKSEKGEEMRERGGIKQSQPEALARDGVVSLWRFCLVRPNTLRAGGDGSVQELGIDVPPFAKRDQGGFEAWVGIHLCCFHVKFANLIGLEAIE